MIMMMIMNVGANIGDDYDVGDMYMLAMVM